MNILVCGPECSGKTELAKHLSGYYQMKLIPEYAVEYLDNLGRSYGYSDIVEIAAEHHKRFREAERAARHVVCDTFLVNLWIWSVYRFGKVDPRIDTWLADSRFDLILLMKPDIAWASGPFRENPHDRDILFGSYLQKLGQLNWPFHIISGSFEEREAEAERCVELVLR